MNGESIVFDGDLKLLDGQHRLMACAESGVTIQAMVVVGIAPSASMSIDQGYRKTGADMLAMHDMSNAQLLASVCRWLRRYEKQAMRVQASDLRNDALPAYAESRPGLQVALALGEGDQGLVVRSTSSDVVLPHESKRAGRCEALLR